MKNNTLNTKAPRRVESLVKKIFLQNWQLYLMLLPTIAYFFIFTYMPISGIQIAFRNYTPRGGIWGSEWVGMKHFLRFFDSPQFSTLLGNTLAISGLSLLFTFPFPIILALFLNECRFSKLKKSVQTLAYAPHFISTVVFVSMITLFLSPSMGIINKIIEACGGTAIDFMGKASWFRPIYVISAIWQNCGWSSIVYIAALAGVDQEMYEAARLDGVGRFQKIWYIDLPSILPTIVTLFIMNCGKVLSVGYEKTFLLQNAMNASVSEIISTYVYKVGLLGAQYSYTTAIGLFNSVVNLAFLLMANKLSKKVTQVGLF